MLAGPCAPSFPFTTPAAGRQRWGEDPMSTLVTTIRKSVAGPWLLSTIATVIAMAALVVTLAMSSNASSRNDTPTTGGNDTSQPGNSSCQRTNQIELITDDAAGSPSPCDMYVMYPMLR